GFLVFEGRAEMIHSGNTDPATLRLARRHIFSATTRRRSADWDQYDRIAAADKRVALVLRPEHIYGSALARLRDAVAKSLDRPPPPTRRRRAMIAGRCPSIAECEHPDHTALRHVGLGAAKRVEPCLHPLGVDTPARLHRDVLHAVDRVRARHAGDAGVGFELPELVARLGIERPEVTVVGAPEEDEAAAGGEDGSPVLVWELVGPHPLAGRHVPGLQLTDVIGALPPAHRGLRALDAEIGLAGLVGIRLRLPHQRAAEVLVGRNIEVFRLRVVAGWRPVLAAPEPGAEGHRRARARLLLLVVARATADRIDLREDFLSDEWPSVHELDRVGAALQPPEITVAARMHQTLHGASVLREVDQERRGHLVPV